jgi:hypothetical protein
MKKNTFFLNTLIVFLIIIFSYLLIDSDFRRVYFSKLLFAYNVYKVESVKKSTVDGDFKKVAEKLESYIETSEDFISGKSKLLPGIYKAANNAVNGAVKQDDFNNLENFFIKLVEIDPKMYDARVWLARSISDTNIEEAWKNINFAINISPGREEAYREAIRLSQKEGDSDLMKKYCVMYKSSQFGSLLTPDYKNFFGSSNLRKFALGFSLGEDQFRVYPHSGIQTNKVAQYEFLPEFPLDTNGFDMYFNLFSGVKTTIKSIDVHTAKNVLKLNISDLMISTKSSYILNSDKNELVLINTDRLNDIVRIRQQNLWRGVHKVVIHMNVERLMLSNFEHCED